ncbi:MAG: CHAD domain-containing protein [Stellaceae bacterium]
MAVIEQELKFAVDPGDLAKIKRALAMAAKQRPSRSTLVSTYFDTADGALQKERMTLRVRKQGRRFLQTVKSEAAHSDLAVRAEWEDPIRQGMPDVTAAETGARVQQAVGTAGLKPLFTTTVKRSIVALRPLPTTLIEVAIDEGEIRAAEGTASQPISELELELRSGEPAALYDVALRLLDAAPLRIEAQSKAQRGYRLVARRKKPPPVVRALPFKFAADATVERVLQEIGRRCLLYVVRNAPAALADVPEAVHQMRVAVRRLRSALAGIKPMLSGEHYAWANGELRSLTAALGAPRAWDVFAEQLLRPVIAALPEEKELGRLARLVERERRAAYQEARKAIGAPETTATILRLSRWFEARAWRDQSVSEQSAQLMGPMRKVAPALIARRFRQAKKRSKNFELLSPADRHRLRIALKKLRYTIEFLACLFDRQEVEGYLDHLKSLQDGLGYVNDVHAAHALLARLHDGGNENTIRQAAGLVVGWHNRSLVDLETELRKQVRRFRHREAFW